MQYLKMQRRQVFQGLIALSAIGGVAACGGSEETSAPRLSQPSDGGYFTVTEMAVLSAIAQTLIPQTETAGAVQAGVPQTLQGLATDWGDDDFRQYWRSGLSALEGALQSDQGAAFTALSPRERDTVLAAYDADVFDNMGDLINGRF